MKTGRKFLIMAGAVAVSLFGGLFSCNSEPEIEPVMTLYDKPLSTIKKVIEGRWQWYVSHGGFAGISYPENTFVEFSEERYIIERYDGRRDTVYFTWKKLPITTYYSSLLGYKTYIIHNNVGNPWGGGLYFHSITNDTLHTRISDIPLHIYDFLEGFDFVRVK